MLWNLYEPPSKIENLYGKFSACREADLRGFRMTNQITASDFSIF